MLMLVPVTGLATPADTSSEPPGRPHAGASVAQACPSPAVLAVRAVPWVSAGCRVGFALSADWLSPVQFWRRVWEGLVTVSEIYTAVYERDGDAWVARIAEEPDVHVLCPSVPEARDSIRNALARRLGTDTSHLQIVDKFPLPAPIRSAQQSVQASRTDEDRTKMMAKITDPRSAMEWAEDLGIAMRDPVTVQALIDLGDKQISVDTFCHTITMAEELSRLTSADCQSAEAVRDQD
jgi:hypothetical protein